MKIAHINIRSMFTGFNDFSLIVQQNDYDVIVISETWINQDDFPQNIFNIPGYNFYNKNRLFGRGGGVGAYVRTLHSCSIISLDFDIPELIDCLFLKITVERKQYAVSVVYRPPKFNLNQFVELMDDAFSVICGSFSNVIGLGDYNVNFLQTQNVVTECLETYNLVQALKEPTRITRSSSRLIDPIFVSANLLVNVCGTLNVDHISDHKLVFCEVSSNHAKMRPKMITFRDFKSFNHDMFLNDLIQRPWQRLLIENNIDNKIQLFNEFITLTYDKHAPNKTVKVTKPRAPWLTVELKDLMSQRDRALSTFKKFKNDFNWNRYKSLRNQVVAMLRLNKKNYLNNICFEKNSKKTWSALKSLNVCISNNKNSIPLNLSDPNKINQYFSRYFQDVNNNCDDLISSYDAADSLENKFNFQMTNCEEVHKILHSLKKESSGCDKISLSMLKYCSPFIDSYLVHIINSCIEQCYFPQLWKQAIGTPLPKKTNPETFSDLRIISILPVASKIMEKLLYTQIINFFNENKLLPTCQNGFRLKFSTADALANITNEICDDYDKGMVSLLVLLDFSKAFDTINHKLLLAKLKFTGFEPDSLNLTKSYLYKRSQSVLYNQTQSSYLDIFSGVPQGSVLGPLLFIIYTADILKSIVNCSPQAFADDTQLKFRIGCENFYRASNIVNTELSRIKGLSLKHNLILNSSKTSVMLFGSQRKVQQLSNNLHLQIDNVPLETVENARNLGLIIDAKLRFKEHANKLIQVSFYKLKLLYNSRHFLNLKLRKELCDSLVLSNFNYCDIIYGGFLDSVTKKRIQKIQNSCCRLIFNLRRHDHISHKIKELGWLNMQNRRSLHVCNHLHKLLHIPDTSEILKSRFIPRTRMHDVNTRNKMEISIPRHRTALFQRSMVYNAIQQYNLLPNAFKTLNLNSFKHSVKIYLLEKQ